MTGQTFPARRLAFRVEYDGTDFHGWQAQPDTPKTIQAELERAIEAFLKQQTRVEGASRTDAGVHALDQLAACTIHHPIAAIGFAKGVNRRLPESIAIRDVFEVAEDFAPRFANEGKIYHYRVYTSRLRKPLIDRYAWRIPWPLDTRSMVDASNHLIGEHDFTSFAASDGSHKTAIRQLDSIDIQFENEQLLISFRGRAFLKQMVRNLVGTLVDVGRGHRPSDSTLEMLAARDRQAAGPTAPARGLTLVKMLMNEDSSTES